MSHPLAEMVISLDVQLGKVGSLSDSTKVHEAVGKTVIGAIVVAIGIPIIVLPFVFWDAYVAAKIWKWFALPLHAPSLSVAQAAGFILLYRVAFGRRGPADEKLTWKDLQTAIVLPALCLFLAWIILRWFL